MGSRAPANFVARWDGTEWLPLGDGLANFAVTLLPLPNGDLVVGGSFTQAGGSHANHLARWDGTRWNYFGEGVGIGSSAATSQPIIHTSIAMPDGTIVVGGEFGNDCECIFCTDI